MAREYPSYNIYRDNRNEWRWTYEAKNAETIAVSSEGYTQYHNAWHSVQLMKNSSGATVYAPVDKS